KLLDALDGVSLIVEHMANALDQLHVLRAIIAAAAPALHGLYLREAGFPETKHMLWKIEILGHFADGTEGVWALVHGATLRQKTESSLISAICALIFKP